ncbi:MAG: DUF222 domain-containing protein [Acidimicrobiia bacterium]
MTTTADRPLADFEGEGFSLWGAPVGGLVGAHGRVVRAEAERLAWIGELVASGAYAEAGYLAPLNLLVDRLGVSVGMAQRWISLARSLAEMPVVRGAFGRGELDEPRVRLLAAAREANPVLFAEAEQVLVDSFSGLSMAEFREGVDLWRQNADLDAAEADAEHLRQRRFLNVSPMLDGLVRVDGQLDPVAGETVLTALRSIADPQQLDPTDTRSPGQRRADALTQLCADHLADGDSPISGGFRPQVTVVAPLAALQGLSGGGHLEDCGVISPETLRRIACDAAITRLVVDPDGMPLDVGRTTRVIPPWIRVALNARDQGCVIPGCQSRPRYCDAHHVVHWLHGGDTKTENLCLLCAHHHTMVHEGKTRLPDHVLERAGRLPSRD